MPRVLQVFEPPDGGVARQVLTLCEGLLDRGWEVEVIGPQDAIIDERLEELGVRRHRLPLQRGFTSPGRDLVALRGTLSAVRRLEPDLVHCHSAKAGVVGRIAARVAQRPLLYSPHCWPFVGDFGWRRRVFAWGVERALAPLTTAFVCVCEDERQRAIETGLDAGRRLWRVYNGCPPCAAGAEDPTLREMREHGPTAAAVTVLREQKSVDVLIDAAPHVFAALPDARIAVVGDGPLSGDLRRRARERGLEGDERFAFLPFAGSSAPHLRAVDVYVLPSAWEAFPIGVLEALACGVPQVATDVGGTSEAVTDETGLLVPPHDPEALAAAIVALLSDPERRAALSAASRRGHAERFEATRMIADTERVYRGVLAQEEEPGASAVPAAAPATGGRRARA